MLGRFEQRAAFGCEWCRLGLEVVDRDAPLVAIAPGPRDVDRIVVAHGAIAIALARRCVDLIRIRSRRLAATRRETRPVGAHDRAHIELLRTVAADLPRHRELIADLDRR